MDTRLNLIIDSLRQRDFRVTPQRYAVLKLLCTSKAHPGPGEVYEQLRQQFPTLSLATVYKTAALLRDMGELTELPMKDGTTRYDGRNPAPHPHVICNRCLKVMDFDAPPLDFLQQEAASATGFHIAGFRLDFFGLCPDCHNN
ncbi:transcriptional repressor [Desulfuromonas sp. KJ2020]|uniref:Fur family transcriptional regulator n=1 Tax=Desulfuromonas sp. KJ2020 TaxID=2919173 RepID=UPI0020A804C5|nr:transcriptional repressor [Desulfuromonas sp. KJ2020]MCP3176502.1 transcriptional repressor [Desulfuromonas sp. KJ2020]